MNFPVFVVERKEPNYFIATSSFFKSLSEATVCMLTFAFDDEIYRISVREYNVQQEVIRFFKDPSNKYIIEFNDELDEQFIKVTNEYKNVLTILDQWLAYKYPTV
jgi:hypothetical protein